MKGREEEGKNKGVEEGSRRRERKGKNAQAGNNTLGRNYWRWSGVLVGG